MKSRRKNNLFWTVLWLIFFFISSSGSGLFRNKNPMSIFPQDLNYPTVQSADINGDGKVNCIDYAVSYKLIWDQKNYGRESYCEIVRNKNPNNNMHHLFVRVRNAYTLEWEYIEPQNGLPMELAWPGLYNPAFNILGETDFWLKKRKF